MTNKQLLVLNAGSSSIKFATYAIDKKIEKINDGSIENIKTAPVFKICDKDKNQIFNEQYTAEHDYDFFYELLLLKLKQANHNVIAVGHRVVHGGKAYHEPVIVSNKIVGELKALEPFAPLHQPFNVAALEIIANKHPELFQVACFDTAFHYTIPPVASHFGLPRHLTDEGVRRYGFHGLSYEYIMSRLKEISPALYDKRVIVAHLGNGASLCAIKQGKSLASTMGFSTLDGLLMGTRCGVIDPGVLLYLMQFKKMGHAAIEELLYKQSGLLGVSGISNNMQVLEQNESPAARDAIELFVYRIQREMGSLVSALEGLDALVFTGGIGENSATIREAVCRNLAWLDIHIDRSANKNKNLFIQSKNAAKAVMVIPTDEEWVIANHTYKLLNSI